VASGVELHPADVPEATEAGQQREDVPPSFSTRSPAYNQLVLRQLMTAIEREHVRHVVIMASDMADLVFLASNIRRYSPDSSILVLSSDLWPLRTDVNPDLYGTIIVSTYPLFFENLRWTFSHSLFWRQFPTETAHGAYNATLAALRKPAFELEQGPPFTSSPGQQTALWASVVGLDELWPLTFQSNGTAGKSDLDLLSVVGCQSYPLRFVCLIFALATFCSLSALTLLTRPLARCQNSLGRWINANMPDWATRLTDAVGKPPFVAFQGLRGNHLACLGAGLFIAAIVGAGYVWLPVTVCGVSSAGRISLGTLTLVSVILSGLAAGVAGRNMIYACPARGELLSCTRATWSWFGTFTIMLVLLLLTIIFVIGVFSTFPAYIPLMFLRVRVWTNGVSPLKPLVFLGIAAAALSLCHLRWVTLLEECYIPRRGFLGFKGQSFAGLRRHERAVSQFLSGGPLDLWGAYCFLGLVVVQGLYYLYETRLFRHALDGPRFGLFYILTSLLVYTGLFFLLLRFLVVWSELHKLLRRLYFHPTRGCYRSLRIKRFGETDDQRIRLLEPTHNMGGVEFCLERARELLRLAQNSSGSKLAASIQHANLQRRIEACEETLLGFHRVAADWREAAPADFAVQRNMAALSAAITELFDPFGDSDRPTSRRRVSRVPLRNTTWLTRLNSLSRLVYSTSSAGFIPK